LEKAAELRRRGEWPAAEALYKQLWIGEPEGGRLRTEALAYGRMALLCGHAADAEAPLREAADASGPLAPYGRLLLGECLLKLAKPSEAAAELRRLLGAAHPKELDRRALLLLAKAESGAGRPAAAVEAYRRLLALQLPKEQRDEANFELASLLERSGRRREAFALYRSLYERPACVYGHAAGERMRRLAAEGVSKLPRRSPAQALEFARRLLAAGRREDALRVLDSIGEHALQGAAAEQEMLLRVSILYALRENAATVEAADRMLALFGPDRTSLLASLKAAWALLRTGNHEAVVARCRSLLEKAGDDQPLRLEALHCMGTSAYVHGLFEEAARDFGEADGSAGSSATAVSASYQRAWCLFRLGDYAGAGRLFLGAAPGRGEAGYEGPSAYWAAQSALRSGDRPAAIGGLVGLAESPAGYWAWQARLALQRMGIPLPATPVPALPSPWDDSISSEQTALARSLDLAGMEADAARAFQSYYRKHRKDPGAALTMAILLARAGRQASAQAILRSSFPGLADRPELPPQALAVEYPAQELGRIRPLAAREGLSPALVLAVIRQESGFDERALSPAGAEGLMQLMPDTAERLAGPSRKDPSARDLMNPQVNLELGIRYLGALTKRLPTAPAVASYNAGEEIVTEWLKAFGAEDEPEFVAMIPYRETRIYTAHVLWNLHRYAEALGR
jgi:soluble lytic murein transglycosylase-like protein